MNPLIIGIDPGSTIGYAILDFGGNLLDLGSFKNGNFSDCILKIKKFGRGTIVGTDVNPTPKFVNKFATKIGAKVICPEENLMIRYKKKIAKDFLKNKNFKVRNKHQLDALSAALIAYKHYMPLFNKIDQRLKQENRDYLSEEIKKKVLVESMPIKKAMEVFD